MTEIGCIRGRQPGAADLELICAWLVDHPAGSRWQLSRELAGHWDWRTPTGQLKDMAARDRLHRRAARGLVVLSARQRSGGGQRPRATLAFARPAVPGLAGRPAPQSGGQTPPLASHLLATGVRRLRTDWLAQHGRPLWLIESFVERTRFADTCCRAANWQRAEDRHAPPGGGPSVQSWRRHRKPWFHRSRC